MGPHILHILIGSTTPFALSKDNFLLTLTVGNFGLVLINLTI